MAFDRRRYEMLKAHGLCPTCKQKAESGHVYCRPCLDEQNAMNRPGRTLRAKLLRQGRAAAGLCMYCGRVPPLSPSKGCRRCLENKRDSDWVRRSRKRALPAEVYATARRAA